MIRVADKSMLPALRELWRQGFGDGTEYVDNFFEWNFDHIKSVVYVDGECPVSVAHLMPVECMETRSQCGYATSAGRAWYLYAATTLPSYRGQGIFESILKYIRESFSEPVFLVPGEKSLIPYYGKRGFCLWQQKRTLEFVCDGKLFDKGIPVTERETGMEPEDFQVMDLGVEEYAARRRELLAGENHIQWNHHFMKYIDFENTFCGGAIKGLTLGEEHFIAMYRKEKSKLHILELLPRNRQGECARVLMGEMGCTQATLCITPDVMVMGDAMESGYFNLFLG